MQQLQVAMTPTGPPIPSSSATPNMVTLPASSGSNLSSQVEPPMSPVLQHTQSGDSNQVGLPPASGGEMRGELSRRNSTGQNKSGVAELSAGGGVLPTSSSSTTHQHGSSGVRDLLPSAEVIQKRMVCRIGRENDDQRENTKRHENKPELLPLLALLRQVTGSKYLAEPPRGQKIAPQENGGMEIARRLLKARNHFPACSGGRRQVVGAIVSGLVFRLVFCLVFRSHSMAVVRLQLRRGQALQ